MNEKLKVLKLYFIFSGSQTWAVPVLPPTWYPGMSVPCAYQGTLAVTWWRMPCSLPASEALMIRCGGFGRLILRLRRRPRRGAARGSRR